MTARTVNLNYLYKNKDFQLLVNTLLKSQIKSKSSEGFKVTRFLEVRQPPVSATNEIQVSVSIS